MTLVANVWDNLRQHLSQVITTLGLIGLLLLSSCSPAESVSSSVDAEDAPPSLFSPRPQIKQVEPPELIQQLEPWLDDYAPLVSIRQPKAEQVFENTTISVNLRVKDLPIYKDETWELGPHIELLLDNQPYASIYDLDQPITLENLTPGTHTLRAFAVRPWNESFKNEEAYAQVTFHVFAKTEEHAPIAAQPLLTYGSPIGTYGAEPVLLDFYLTDAPLHQVAAENPAIDDWRVRYTIKGESLTLDTWESIYIEGLKPGRNWVQLTLVDTEGKPIPGVFNNTVRLIDYDPTVQDGLAKIVNGEARLEMVGTIVDPSYEPPVVEDPVVTDPIESLDTDTESLDIDELAPEPNNSDIDEAVPEVPDSEEQNSKTTSPESQPLDSNLDVAPLEDTGGQTADGDATGIEPKTTANTPPTVTTEDAVETTSENSEATIDAVDTSPNDQPSEEILDNESLDNQRPSGDIPELVDEPNTVFEKLDETIATSPDSESMAENSVPSADESQIAGSETSPRQYFQNLYDYRERAMNRREP
ncbi:MAG: hypothetical protein AAF959_12280 [Cyanobacteria bacterium P01_D01_bin.56]